jgi:O-antigen/teichoic acid export membrane protein
MSNLKESAVSGVFWVTAERFGIQFVNFVVSIVLARLLMPKDFGIVGIVTVFITIAEVLIDGGLANSLIRTKNPQPVDYSVVFLSNLLVSITAYFLLFFFAPFIAAFFKIPLLTSLFRVLGLVIVIRSLAIIQITKLVLEFNFKKHLTIQIPSVLAGGITGIVMASLGYGVWSIVGSQLATAFFLSVQLWLRSTWRPALVFDRTIFKKHFLYGSNLMGAQMIKVIFQNIFNFVVAKVYTPVQLGYFSRANGMKQIPVETFATALSKVTFPLFSRLQDDMERLRTAYIKITQQVFYVIAPLFIFLIIMAEPLFRFLFTEKWVPAVPYFQLLCIAGIIQPFNFYNGNILNARGKANLLFRLEVIKRIVLTGGIFIIYRYGMYALICLEISYFFFSFLLNASFAGRELHLGVWYQVGYILPIFICALFSGAAIWLLDTFHFINSDLLRLLVGGLGYIIFFISTTLIFKISPAREFFQLIFIILKKIKYRRLFQFNI